MSYTLHMKKERLHYIDLAKGLLIIFMMATHCLSGIQRYADHDSFLITMQDIKDFSWIPFFMPAFFFITGYCSNFDRDIKSFFISNFKSIKIPSVTLTFIFALISMIYKHDFASIIPDFFERFVHCGLWFLDALFISKFIYWWGHKYIQNKKLLGFFMLLLFIIACFVQIYIDQEDYLSINHALFLTPFIWLGKVMKNNKLDGKIGLTCLVLYLSVSIMISLFGIERPYITRKIVVSVSTIIPLAILSVSGTLSFVWICKLLKSNRILEYIGFNSIIYYCLNGRTLSVQSLFYPYFSQSFLLSLVFFVIVMVIALLISAVASYVLNRKYISVLLGKF